MMKIRKMMKIAEEEIEEQTEDDIANEADKDKHTNAGDEKDYEDESDDNDEKEEEEIVEQTEDEIFNEAGIDKHTDAEAVVLAVELGWCSASMCAMNNSDLMSNENFT